MKLNTTTDDHENLAEQQTLTTNIFKNCWYSVRNRNGFVDLLLILFGIGSWIGINSTYLQVPLLVDTAPEGWRLPSFITIIIQIGNLGPILYTILQNFPRLRISDAHIIYGVKLIGAISAFLMAFSYKQTTLIGDQKYSLALLVLVFCLALVACTSSVLFMPYMGRFKEIYLVTYLVGEGVSGLVPSILALIQGIGGSTKCILIDGSSPPKYEPFRQQPKFTTMAFFLIIFAVMLGSLIAFILLENLRTCKNEYATAVRIGHGNTYNYASEDSSGNSQTASNSKMSKRYFCQILIILAVISFIGNGVLPSIQSYSCMPYGNNVYHLTVSLTLIVNPISCLLAIFLPHSSIRLILTLIGCFCLTSSYIIVMAVMSPSPPMFNGSEWGGIIVIIVWTIHVGIFSYIKLCITTLMRSQGGNSLVWTGGIAQAGTAAGSIITFVLVNFTKIFIAADPCPSV